jgi:hypothetical protein
MGGLYTSYSCFSWLQTQDYSINMSDGIAGMRNGAGDMVDLYIPRKCSWTNRLLAANDFGSIQVKSPL